MKALSDYRKSVESEQLSWVHEWSTNEFWDTLPIDLQQDAIDRPQLEPFGYTLH